MTRRGTILAAVLAAACHSAKPPPSASFHGPTAAAVFAGRISAHPGAVWPYLAVADGRSDDLRIVDPSTNTALPSPGYAFPLSIPTLARPLYLASASLRDGESDLLAVAGMGTGVGTGTTGVGTVVQVVATWADGSDGGGPRVVNSWDLSGLAGPGAEILSMIAVPYPGTASGSPPVAAAVPGKALLVVGFSGSSDGLGGKLVVLQFERGADGRSVQLAGALPVQPLGFDPVSMALSPDGFHLYCATPDPITDFSASTGFPPPPGSRQVRGVAEVDMSAGEAGSWAVRGLDALAPTTLVTAATVGERLETQPDQFGPPVARVYAALDTSGCGLEHDIACGVATLDPATGGLAADPAPTGGAVPAQPFRTPYHLPAMALGLSAAMPAASGPQQCLNDCSAKQGPDQTTAIQPLMLLAPATGQRWTPGAAVAPAADGNAYILDLGRYSSPNQLVMLNAAASTQRMRVSGSAWSSPAGSSATAVIGLYLQYPGTTQVAGLYDDSTVERSVILTPGFTTDELWSITWQGPLPGLVREACDIGLLADGNLALGLQSPLGTGWLVGPNVNDPHLGIHATADFPDGDLAQFEFVTDPCGMTDATGASVPHEATVVALLPASADFPAGALELAVPGSSSPDPFNLRCLASALAGGASFASSGGWATVRASGLVLTGSRTGYAGRPPLLTKADVAAGNPAAARFNFAWADEATLKALAPTSVPAAQALVLARKARRFYYSWLPPSLPGGIDLYSALYPELTDPLAPGPVVGFIAGPLCFDVATPDHVCPDTELGGLLRDTSLVFQTYSGVLAMARAPIPISLPTGAVAFDASQFGAASPGAVWYVPYQYDSVFLVAPGSFATISTTIR